jgi:hypothetical protein
MTLIRLSALAGVAAAVLAVAALAGFVVVVGAAPLADAAEHEGLAQHRRRTTLERHGERPREVAGIRDHGRKTLPREVGAGREVDASVPLRRVADLAGAAVHDEAADVDETERAAFADRDADAHVVSGKEHRAPGDQRHLDRSAASTDQAGHDEVALQGARRSVSARCYVDDSRVHGFTD